MATNNNESNSGLWFLIGAVIIAVAGILWYLNSGGTPADTATVPAAGGDTNVTVTTPAAPAEPAPAATDAAPAAPAATDPAPADGAAGTTGSN